MYGLSSMDMLKIQIMLFFDTIKDFFLGILDVGTGILRIGLLLYAIHSIFSPTVKIVDKIMSILILILVWNLGPNIVG